MIHLNVSDKATHKASILFHLGLHNFGLGDGVQQSSKSLSTINQNQCTAV